MVMTRYDKVVGLARCIDAARGRASAAGKDKEADPDAYREEHGRCPDGYEYDPLSDTCEPKDAEPEDTEDTERKSEKQEPEDKGADEAKEEQKDEGKKPPPDRPPSPKTPGDWLDGRKARGDYLEQLFHDDPELYQQEADRMRESGELPDRETAEMLVKIKDIDDLPEDVLKDKEKLAKIIAQQDAQRRIEEMVLERAEQELKDLEKRREIALKAGKKPPKLDAFKFLNDIEQMYNRDMLGDSEKIEAILDEQEDEFIGIVSDAATKPGEPAYWWKKWWEKVTKPIPTWTPGESSAFEDLGFDKLVGGSAMKGMVTAGDAPSLHDLVLERKYPPTGDKAKDGQRWKSWNRFRERNSNAYNRFEEKHGHEAVKCEVCWKGTLRSKAHLVMTDDDLNVNAPGSEPRWVGPICWKLLLPDIKPYEVKDAKLRAEASVTAKTMTSPGITNMERGQIGFPPYDQDRKPRRHIADQPSGRPAFPPYDEVEPVEYTARDAQMQGFPPYDGKGGPHDTETVGLPPYNGKPAHKGRGFPPYHDGKSVYQHRRRTVDLAVK
jgi:hypothetical protein